MIHIITSQNRALYGPQLRAMRLERGRRCVEREVGRDLAALESGEADDDRTIDLLGFDEAMRLEVGLRLRPTDDRCVLADRFPQLIAPDESAKKGADVWEAAGVFTAEASLRLEGPVRAARVFECWAAAFELALRHGVTRFVGLIDMERYPGVQNWPIDIRLVGTPRPHAHGVVAGSEILVSPAMLGRVLEAIGREAPVGYEIDDLDLTAFGDLAAVQRQVVRAMAPQMAAGTERDETLAAATLYRLHDTVGQVGWSQDGPRARLHA